MKVTIFTLLFATWIILAIWTESVRGVPTLNCNSSTPVNCDWQVNSKSVAVTQQNGLEYVTGDGIHTKDCSIRIRRIGDPRLQGNWTCWSRSTDKIDGSQLSQHWYNLDQWLKIRNGVVKIEEKPRNNISAQEGSSVILRCKFGAFVNCNWLRNGGPLTMGGRYRSINNEEGMYSTDCSIEISNLQMVDQGAWQFTNYVNEGKGYASTEPVMLTLQGQAENIAHPITSNFVIQNPESKEVGVGDDVTLHCLFLQPVTCAWFIDGRRLRIHYRLSFTNYTNGYRQYTTDCSIKISTVTWTDFGSWTCASQGNSSSISITSKPAFLKEKQDTAPLRSIIHNIQREVVAIPKQSIELSCREENVDAVSCLWSRNDIPLFVSGRYSYKTTQHTSPGDCSMIIENVSSIDEGNWKCQVQDSHQNVALHQTNLKISKSKPVPVIKVNGSEVHEISWEQIKDGSPTCTILSTDVKSWKLHWKMGHDRLPGQVKVHSDETKRNGNISLTLDTEYYNETHNNVTSLSCIAENSKLATKQVATVAVRVDESKEEVNPDSSTVCKSYVLPLAVVSGIAVVLGILAFILVWINRANSREEKDDQTKQVNNSECNYETEIIASNNESVAIRKKKAESLV